MAGLGSISFPAEEPEDQRQDDADEDARGDREVEGELLALDGEVAGQAADPGDLAAHDHQDAHDGDDEADEDKGFPEIEEAAHRMFPLPFRD
jgi:hypothetical protein